MFSLEMTGPPLDKGNIIDLTTHRFDNGNPFPASYQEFTQQYGYGLAMNLFFIYIPMDEYGDSWNVRTEEIKDTYIDDISGDEEPYFELEPDGSMELLQSWVPFASSENGDYLFWDIREMKNNEFDIYMTDFRSGIRKVAANLHELIEKMTDPNRFKEVMPFRSRPLQPVFKPLARQEA